MAAVEGHQSDQAVGARGALSELRERGSGVAREAWFVHGAVTVRADIQKPLARTGGQPELIRQGDAIDLDCPRRVRVEEPPDSCIASAGVPELNRCEVRVTPVKVSPEPLG